MGAVVIHHRDPGVRNALRRGLRRAAVRVASCRTMGRVERMLRSDLVDAIVLDVRSDGMRTANALIERFPGVPLFAFSAFRPDDGRLLAECEAAGVRGVFVDGIDDPAAGELIAAQSAARDRSDALANAPRVLRLTESIQRKAWRLVLARVDEPLRTADIARGMGRSREHLSREFAAGGAPNLKRVIDLARICCAAHLLRNPGHSIADVARIMRFSSPGHLAGCSARISGVRPSGLGTVGPEGVLLRFARGRTRSRL